MYSGVKYDWEDFSSFLLSVALLPVSRCCLFFRCESHFLSENLDGSVAFGVIHLHRAHTKNRGFFTFPKRSIRDTRSPPASIQFYMLERCYVCLLMILGFFYCPVLISSGKKKVCSDAFHRYTHLSMNINEQEEEKKSYLLPLLHCLCCWIMWVMQIADVHQLYSPNCILIRLHYDSGWRAGQTKGTHRPFV